MIELSKVLFYFSNETNSDAFVEVKDSDPGVRVLRVEERYEPFYIIFNLLLSIKVVCFLTYFNMIYSLPYYY